MPRQSSSSSGLPIGAIISHGSETPPAGYLECNGAAVSRTIYVALFTAIGVSFGYGDNSTTFNLPDLRGRFLRGFDHAVSRDPDKATRTAMATGGQTGDRVGSVQAEAFKAHTHTTQLTTNATGVSGFGFAPNGNGIWLSTGSNGGNETRPLNAGVMFCIKYA